VLLRGVSYGVKLRDLIKVEYPQFAVSDTILYEALTLLESEGVIDSFWQKIDGSVGDSVAGQEEPFGRKSESAGLLPDTEEPPQRTNRRGRPRRMLRIVTGQRNVAEELAQFWKKETQDKY
jgi:hypothetical protein